MSLFPPDEMIGKVVRALARGLSTMGSDDVIATPECRRIERLFKQAGALSPGSALRFFPRTQAEAHAFERMLETFAICQPTRGRYFLDEARLRDVRLSLLELD